jgi:O-antigen/teichoic acid export membrane protein
MKRKFLVNLAFLLFLNFLIKPFWVFGIDRAVQNQVGAADYGFYFAILNFAFVFQILLDFGITNFNNRNIAQNNHLLDKHFSPLLVLRFVFSLLYFFIILLAGWMIGFDSEQMFLLVIIGFNQFLLALILYLRSNISALLLFKTDSFISVLDRMIMIMLCSILLWSGYFPNFEIAWFVYSQTVAYLLTALVTFLVVYQKVQFSWSKWNFTFYRAIIKSSLPYATLILLMGLYSRVDTIFIERLLPEDGELQAGIYASAFRLLDVANNMSGYLFAALLLPMFSRLLKEGQEVGGLVKMSFNLLFLVSVTVAAISLFYAEPIMQLLYSQHSSETLIQYQLRMHETAIIFKILMWTFVASSITYIFGTLLTANGNLKRLNLMALFGIVLVFTLNFILVPPFKAIGASVSSFVVQWVMALAQVYLAVRILKLKLDWMYVVKLLSFILFAVLLVYFLKQTHFNILWQILGSGVAILLLAMGLKLLSLKSFFRNLVQEKT